jgi:hypothetical protein
MIDVGVRKHDSMKHTYINRQFSILPGHLRTMSLEQATVERDRPPVDME